MAAAEPGGNQRVGEARGGAVQRREAQTIIAENDGVARRPAGSGARKRNDATR